VQARVGLHPNGHARRASAARRTRAEGHRLLLLPSLLLLLLLLLLILMLLLMRGVRRAVRGAACGAACGVRQTRRIRV
jgi:hypothetical protein